MNLWIKGEVPVGDGLFAFDVLVLDDDGDELDGGGGGGGGGRGEEGLGAAVEVLGLFGLRHGLIL